MSASSLGSEQRAGVVRVVPETDEIVAVCLEGDFDLGNAPALGTEVGRALENGNDLILDLSQATFIDSSVVHVLVNASRAAIGSKRAVVLQLGTAPIVERVLESESDLFANGRGVAEIEISLKADGDDLVGLRDNANDSALLRAKGCSGHLVPPSRGPIDRPARKSGPTWASRLARPGS